MPNPVITPQQVEQLDLYGFIKLPRMFNRDEAQRLVALVDTTADEVRQGHRDEPDGFVWIVPPTVVHEAFRTLFDDERVSGVAETVIGPGCVYLGQSVAGVSSHATGWHAAVPTEGHRELRVAVCLETAVDAADTPEMIPGSHHREYNMALRRAFETGILDVRDAETLGAVRVCPTEPGDVLLFDAAVWHRGSAASHARRKIHYAFHAWSELTEAAVERTLNATLWGKGYELYDEQFVASASGRRLRLIRPVLDLGQADGRRSISRAEALGAAYLPVPG